MVPDALSQPAPGVQADECKFEADTKELKGKFELEGFLKPSDVSALRAALAPDPAASLPVDILCGILNHCSSARYCFARYGRRRGSKVCFVGRKWRAAVTVTVTVRSP